MKTVQKLLSFIFVFFMICNLSAANFSESAYQDFYLNDIDEACDIYFTETNILNTASTFGYSISNIGDFNGDGFPDFAISAINAGYNDGRVYIYYGGPDFDDEPDLTFYGSHKNAYLGTSVSGAGDVNSDGYSDLLISYQDELGQCLCALYLGKEDPDTTQFLVFSGEDAPFTKFGNDVSTAGDVNNDGYDDIIIGDYGYDDYDGRAYIFLGGTDMDTSYDFVFNPVILDTSYNTGFANDVCSVGDANNDGYDDILIGAYLDGYSYGSAYLFFGGEGMDTTFVKMVPQEMEILHSGNFGQSVSSAGDFNNDGFDDFIIGTEYNTLAYKGSAYIYYGADQLDTMKVDSFPDMKLMIDEEDINNFGYCVASAGDMNNDGFPDIMVSSIGSSDYPGQVFIYFGGSEPDSIADLNIEGESSGVFSYEGKSGFGSKLADLGDVNNDGIDDIIIGNYDYYASAGKCYIYYGGNPPDAYLDMPLEGEAEDLFLAYKTTIVKDVNGDGFDDILLTAPGYKSANLSEFGIGRAYLYFGGTNADSLADLIFEGEYNIGNFGISAAQAGDFNNDGYGDFIIGAYNKAYLYFGGNKFDTKADVTFEGSYYKEQLGNSVACAGDVNGDGFDDIIIGAWGRDDYAGRAYIYFGNDSLDNQADVSFNLESSMVTYYGYSVSGIGDINKDGFADVAVSDIGMAYTGRVKIYFGAEEMDAVEDLAIYGEGSSSNFGQAICSAGDFNNDGYDDFVISDESYSTNIGRAYLYYGSESPDNSADLIFEDVSYNDYFGWALDGGSDVNLDGYSDVVVGAKGDINNSGKIYIYLGGNEPDAEPEYSYIGRSIEDLFGSAVSIGGDVNNDGRADILVGAYGTPENGSAYLIYSDYETAIDANINVVPLKFSLEQNYPNPFNPVTKIKYTIEKSARVKLTLYDILGREVRVLLDKQQDANEYVYKLDATRLASGIYFYKLEAGEKTQIKKMMLIK